MRISDWSSDVCSSDLLVGPEIGERGRRRHAHGEDYAGFVAVSADEERHVDRLTARKNAPWRFAHQLAVENGADHRARRPDIAGRDERVGRKRSEEHKSELQSLMRISYAVLCLTKQNNTQNERTTSPS